MEGAKRLQREVDDLLETGADGTRERTQWFERVREDIADNNPDADIPPFPAVIAGGWSRDAKAWLIRDTANRRLLRRVKASDLESAIAAERDPAILDMMLRFSRSAVKPPRGANAIEGRRALVARLKWTAAFGYLFLRQTGLDRLDEERDVVAAALVRSRYKHWLPNVDKKTRESAVLLRGHKLGSKHKRAAVVAAIVYGRFRKAFEQTGLLDPRKQPAAFYAGYILPNLSRAQSLVRSNPSLLGLDSAWVRLFLLGEAKDPRLRVTYPKR